jgi:hypothetical protein
MAVSSVNNPKPKSLYTPRRQTAGKTKLHFLASVLGWVTGQIHAPAPLPLKKKPGCQSNGRLSGHQRRSGHCKEGKRIFYLNRELNHDSSDTNSVA